MPPRDDNPYESPQSANDKSRLGKGRRPWRLALLIICALIIAALIAYALLIAVVGICMAVTWG